MESTTTETFEMLHLVKRDDEYEWGFTKGEFWGMWAGIIGTVVGIIICAIQYCYTWRKDRRDSKDRLSEAEIDRVWDMGEKDDEIKVKKDELEEVKEDFSGNGATRSEKRVWKSREFMIESKIKKLKKKISKNLGDTSASLSQSPINTPNDGSS